MKISRLLSILAFLGLLMSFTFGCKKDSPITPDPIINTKTKVIIIDTTVVSKKLDEISADGTLRFSGMSTTETPKKGDIICSGPATNAPLGFLYRVTNVTQVGNTTTITTETASIEEAVEDAEVTKEVNLTDYIVSFTNDLGETIPISEITTKSERSSGLKLIVDKTVELNNYASCKIEGSVETNLNFVFDLSIKKWNLKWLSLSVQPQFKSTLIAAIEGTIKDSTTIKLGEFEIRPIIFMVGIFPIVINPKLQIDLLISVEGKIQLVAKIIDVDLKYTAGVKYDEGKLSLINQNDSKPISILEETELSLSGKLKLEPQLICNVKFYNQEAYVGINTGFYAKLITDDISLNAQVLYGTELLNPKMRFITGMSLAPQAKLQVFSKKIAEWKPVINVVSWNIWEKGMFPVFSTIKLENPSKFSVTAKCQIEMLAAYLFQTNQHGFCWGRGEYPTVESDEKNQLGEINNLSTFGKQSMSAEIGDLKANTTYTIRPYFTSWIGTFYAQSNKFTTLNITKPTVITATVTNITSTTAIVGGNIADDGGAEITDRGVYWSKSKISEESGSKLSIGNGAGLFSTTLKNLDPVTIYFIKTYATNSVGTVYGEEISFKTKQKLSLATVTTASAKNITAKGATLGGNVTADGNAEVTEKGIYYSTEKDPKASGTKVSYGEGKIGSFAIDVSELSSDKTYYVQAYAKNSVGTAYGSTVSFKTEKALSLATVTTASAKNITAKGATLGGNVIADGNSAVTEKGIYYSTSPDPKTTGTKVSSGKGEVGTFTINLSDLSPDKTYYVQAYAVNSQGIAYGNEISFNTDKDVSDIVKIPDPAFKSYCVANFDTNGDGEIQIEEAAGVTFIWAVSLGIKSMEGIEFFTSLTDLYCHWNSNITSLDVSKNTQLTILSCHSNPITSLDVSNNTLLTRLHCFSCQITSLDVSKNSALTFLDVNSNQLKSLDVSKNTALTSLYCSNNQIKSLDVGRNILLTTLKCSNNGLSSLDISKNTLLTELHCARNQLTLLDVSKNDRLIHLECNYNGFTSLDVNNNILLSRLFCGDNQIASLDVSKNIALTYLLCESNKLTSLDVSKNIALTNIACYYNQLTTIDLSSNTLLKEFSCGVNQLTSLDVSGNIVLDRLNCLSNPNLTELWMKNGQSISNIWKNDYTIIYYKP